MRSHRLNAAPQVEIVGQVIAKSVVGNPMNRNKDGIFFQLMRNKHTKEIIVLQKREKLEKIKQIKKWLFLLIMNFIRHRVSG